MDRRTFLIGSLLLIPTISLAQSNKIKTALVIALDASGSVNPEEFELQRTGIAKALIDPGFIDAATFGEGVAITIFLWGGSTHLYVPWTLLKTEQDCYSFAETLLKTRVPPVSSFSTNIKKALFFASELHQKCPWIATNKVVDISGDGVNNEYDENISVGSVRDYLVSQNITINGLPITGPGADGDVAMHYRDEVIGGNGAFMIEIKDYQDFPKAMRQKLIVEIM